MHKNKPAYIIHYYFKKLNKYASQVQKGYAEDTIHFFRVDVKKLRAFLRMMRLQAKEPDELKFPKNFKKMYSLTGKIRDRQLCLKRIEEYNKSGDTRLKNKIQSLEKEIKDLAEKRDDFLTRKEFTEIEEKTIKQIPTLDSDHLLKNFFQDKLNSINRIVSKREFKDNELHSIRKNIKDIIYINRIFRDDLKAPLPFSFWNETELKNAENLSHKLGLFNDACVALSFLIPADIKKDDTGETEHLLSARRQWLAEKQKLKKEILNEIPLIKLDML